MFERYAIFYTPTGDFADWGAAWLGWDSAKGAAVGHPDIAGLDAAALTATPRKYGLHATLKAPFRLAQGVDLAQVQNAAASFARAHARFDIGALELRNDTGFVALRPQVESAVLQGFAAEIVKVFAPYPAPLSDTDIARRRKSNLSARQDQQMLDWGYPFVFEDFHFHLTLTGRLPPDHATQVITALQPHIFAVVPDPFVIDAITLMGQDNAGLFHQIHRYVLTG